MLVLHALFCWLIPFISSLVLYWHGLHSAPAVYIDYFKEYNHLDSKLIFNATNRETIHLTVGSPEHVVGCGAQISAVGKGSCTP